MYPRPKARGPGRETRLPDPDAMAEQIAALRRQGAEPVAILAGPRDWRRFRLLPEARRHLQFWPGGDVTFERVAVIIRNGFDAPVIYETMSDLEEVLLP